MFYCQMKYIFCAIVFKNRICSFIICWYLYSLLGQSAKAVEYTDYISVERLDRTNEYAGYDTK